MLDFINTPFDVPIWLRLLYIIATVTIFVIGFKTLRTYYFSPKMQNQKSTGLIIFLIIFALFYCLNTDYFGYRHLVTHVDSAEFYHDHMELVPQFFARLFTNNYDLFRLTIWGGAILLTYYVSRKLSVHPYLSLLFWFLFYYDCVFYARASLAMAVFFTGIALMVTHKTFSPRFLTGAAIMLSSIFFHKEMIVAIAVVPFMFIPITKKNLFFLVGLFLVIFLPLSSYVMNNPSMLGQLDSGGESYDMKFARFTQNVVEGGDTFEATWKGMIMLLLSYFIYYAIFIIISVAVLKKENRQFIPDSIQKLYRVAFGVVFAATFFLFLYGQNNIFFYRTLYISFSSCAILLAYLFSKNMVKVNHIKLLLYATLLHLSLGWLSNFV